MYCTPPSPSYGRLLMNFKINVNWIPKSEKAIAANVHPIVLMLQKEKTVLLIF